MTKTELKERLLKTRNREDERCYLWDTIRRSGWDYAEKHHKDLIKQFNLSKPETKRETRIHEIFKDFKIFHKQFQAQKRFIKLVGPKTK